jgi:hypothetical protein
LKVAHAGQLTTHSTGARIEWLSLSFFRHKLNASCRAQLIRALDCYMPMSEERPDKWAGLKIAIEVIGCLALSDLLGLWLPKPLAQGLGFFLIPLASYKFLGAHRRMKFMAWTGLIILFALGVTAVGFIASYIEQSWSK